MAKSDENLINAASFRTENYFAHRATAYHQFYLANLTHKKSLGNAHWE